MAVHSPHPKLTFEDYLRLPDDGRRHEILDGIYAVTATPFYPHQRASSQLHIAIGSFVNRHDLGVLLAAPMAVRLSEHDVVEPDLLFVSHARSPVLTEEYLVGAPDLIIEILSPSTRRRDLGLKRARYERLGVAEYWGVDPQRKAVQVFRRGASSAGPAPAFLPPLHLTEEAGHLLSTALLPGFELALREVFRR